MKILISNFSFVFLGRSLCKIKSGGHYWQKPENSWKFFWLLFRYIHSSMQLNIQNANFLIFYDTLLSNRENFRALKLPELAPGTISVAFMQWYRAFKRQHRAFKWQYIAFKWLHIAFKRQHRAFKRLHSAFKRLHSAFKRLHSTFKGLHGDFNRLHGAFKPRHCDF